MSAIIIIIVYILTINITSSNIFRKFFDHSTLDQIQVIKEYNLGRIGDIPIQKVPYSKNHHFKEDFANSKNKIDILVRKFRTSKIDDF